MGNPWGSFENALFQFLNLFRIPVDLRKWLQAMSDVTEAKLWSMVQMNLAKIRGAVERMFGFKIMSRVG